MTKYREKQHVKYTANHAGMEQLQINNSAATIHLEQKSSNPVDTTHEVLSDQKQNLTSPTAINTEQLPSPITVSQNSKQNNSKDGNYHVIFNANKYTPSQTPSKSTKKNNFYHKSTPFRYYHHPPTYSHHQDLRKQAFLKYDYQTSCKRKNKAKEWLTYLHFVHQTLNEK